MQAYRVSAEQFRRQLADVLNRVSYGGDKVIVERYGSPQAVLIPYGTYQQFEELIEQNRGQLSEDEFEQELVTAGLLSMTPSGGMNPALFSDRQPFEVEGKPLSEIILEERR